MIEKVRYIDASKLREVIGELARPDPGSVFIVTKRKRPVLLIWPARGLTDEGTLRTRITQAVKAHNASGEGTELAVPEYPHEISQTELRRGATPFYLDLASHPRPGVITHYGQKAALFVPVGSARTVGRWVETMNALLN